MKKLLAAFALTFAVWAAPASADLGISVRIGEPGFYGQLDIGNFFAPPRVVYSQPVVVVERYRHLEPIYLRVPHDHSRHWNRHCARYNACARPVYFVRDEWYRDVYAPSYRQVHAHARPDYRRAARYDGRYDRYDRGHGNKHSRGHRNGWR